MPWDLTAIPALVGDWPLVGRDAELEAIASARANPASHGVVVVADAGVGKSRLAREGQAAAQRDGGVCWPVAEAEVHFQQRDPFNVMLTVRALEVGIACFTGDFDGTMAALAQLHAWSDSHGPLPAQRVPVRRAEGWALRMRDPAEAGRRPLEDASSLEQMVGLAPQLAYDALRVGAPAAPVLGADGRPERVAARHRLCAPWFGEGGPRRLGSDGRRRGDGGDRRGPLCRRGCQ
jgi:AAA ATPase domain